ncbi:MAG: hypothetical protein QG635_1291 [Bacteroidota bacterium]|nr:hypothetical protein [Bacteroidota bacterium]
MSKYKILVAVSLLTLAASGCSLVKKAAGADIDPIRFDKARQAKTLEVRRISAERLAARLANGSSIQDADMTFLLKDTFLNKIVRQYEGAQGWLDASTSYQVNKVLITLMYGSAIASVDMTAHSESYNVDVDMTLDCLLVLEQSGMELQIKLEPFNISPKVKAGILLSSAEEIISNLIKINVGGLSSNFPPLKVPVDFTNNFKVPESKAIIKDKVNLTLKSPERSISFTMKLKEILIFEGIVFVAMNIDRTEAK